MLPLQYQHIDLTSTLHGDVTFTTRHKIHTYFLLATSVQEFGCIPGCKVCRGPGMVSMVRFLLMNLARFFLASTGHSRFLLQ